MPHQGYGEILAFIGRCANALFLLGGHRQPDPCQPTGDAAGFFPVQIPSRSPAIEAELPEIAEELDRSPANKTVLGDPTLHQDKPQQCDSTPHR